MLFNSFLLAAVFSFSISTASSAWFQDCHLCFNLHSDIVLPGATAVPAKWINWKIHFDHNFFSRFAGVNKNLKWLRLFTWEPLLKFIIGCQELCNWLGEFFSSAQLGDETGTLLDISGVARAGTHVIINSTQSALAPALDRWMLVNIHLLFPRALCAIEWLWRGIDKWKNNFNGSQKFN